MPLKLSSLKIRYTSFTIRFYAFRGRLFFLIQSIHVKKKMLNQQCGNSGHAGVLIYTKYMPLDQNILKYY